MLKIAFISDGRGSSNWGCRATSIALEQILTCENDLIADTVYNDFKSKEICVKSLLKNVTTNKQFSFINKAQIHSRFFKLIIQVDKLLGAKYDFISISPEKSLNVFFKHKNKNPELLNIYKMIDKTDIVVINGEGDMIFNPNRRSLLFLLMIIELAYKLNKPVFYVNAMVSECPIVGRDNELVNECIKSLKKCSGVTLRDTYSFDLVKSLDPNIKCKFIPDALFAWFHYYQSGIVDISCGDIVLPFPYDKAFGEYNFKEPYICIGGSSLAPKMSMDDLYISYKNLIKEIKKIGCNIYLIMAAPGDSFLLDLSKNYKLPIIPVTTPVLLGGAVLANASLFISGRYHPSILASLGGTPCIFFNSNSHKTYSLQKILNYERVREYPLFLMEQDVSELRNDAEKKINSGNLLRQNIISNVKDLSYNSKHVLSYIKERVN